MTRFRRASAAVVLGLAGAVLTGCEAGSAPAAGTPAATPMPSSSTTASPGSSPVPGSAPTSCVTETLAGLTLEERVGQLLMLGFVAGGSPDRARRAVLDHHLGSVTLIGRSYAGTADVRRMTDELQEAAGLPLFVGTDQEGGQVQVLHGAGFPEMPSAEVQGRLPVAELERRAERWGAALVEAGVNLNLAPVLDVVPRELGSANQPIGRYHRAFGSTPSAVTSHGLAFARGMQAAGVIPVVKHFPGLGGVRGNPDVAVGVVETRTSSDSASLEPFRAAVEAGAPMVMTSSARYERLDPGRLALFSPDVVTGLLREDLGFTGVVVSDDVGAAAAVRADAPVAARAFRFLEAGGDLVLTVQVDDIAIMSEGLVERARTRASFADRVDESATRVLRAKDEAGLLRCSAS